MIEETYNLRRYVKCARCDYEHPVSDQYVAEPGAICWRCYRKINYDLSRQALRDILRSHDRAPKGSRLA